MEFSLNASADTVKHKEFKVLEKKCKQLISTVQVNLKAEIVKYIRLEIKILQEKTKKHFCKSMKLITEAIVINSNKADHTSIDAVVAALFKSHHERLL
eukprot:1233510-Ditylum_brightwellii.AAC.1